MALVVTLSGPAAMLLLCLGLWLALGWVVYQLKFHPLAKYPGPFLAKFTHGYAAYHAWRQDLHLDMWRCHQKYGDFVRYGPDRMLINTATGMKDIYGVGKNVIKSQGYNAMIHRTPSVLTLRDKKEHSSRRRLIGEGLSDFAIRSYEPAIISQVKKFCDLLGPQSVEENSSEKSCDGSRKWSSPQNMTSWCNYLAFDIMADVVFGQKYNLLGEAKNRYIVDAIAGSNVRTTVLLYLPKLVIGRLDKKLFPASIKARNSLLRFVGKLLYERSQLSAPMRTDIFSILQSAKDAKTGRGLQTEEIGAESTTLVIAGSDTTATSLASIFFYLSHYPDALAKARDEVRRVFRSSDDIRLGVQLNSCQYLRMCIDESMRITPPIGASLFREASHGGVTVDGHFFPAGIDVGTSIYSIHHHPRYFPRPHRFMPERWAGGAATPAALNPFSLGPRSCIGKSLAIVEIMLAMATVLWHYDFKLVEGPAGRAGEGRSDHVWGRRNPDEFQLYHGGITSVKDGPVLQFARRD